HCQIITDHVSGTLDQPRFWARSARRVRPSTHVVKAVIVGAEPASLLVFFPPRVHGVFPPPRPWQRGAANARTPGTQPFSRCPPSPACALASQPPLCCCERRCAWLRMLTTPLRCSAPPLHSHTLTLASP